MQTISLKFQNLNSISYITSNNTEYKNNISTTEPIQIFSLEQILSISKPRINLLSHNPQP